jgi:hypothetical protein
MTGLERNSDYRESKPHGPDRLLMSLVPCVAARLAFPLTASPKRVLAVSESVSASESALAEALTEADRVNGNHWRGAKAVSAAISSNPADYSQPAPDRLAG